MDKFGDTSVQHLVVQVHDIRHTKAAGPILVLLIHGKQLGQHACGVYLFGMGARRGLQQKPAFVFLQFERGQVARRRQQKTIIVIDAIVQPIDAGVDTAAVAEHLLLFIHTMVPVLLKCLFCREFFASEGQIHLHQFHHTRFQSAGHLFRHPALQSVQSAVFAAGDRVQDAQFHPRKHILNRLEQQKIERPAVHRIPVKGGGVEKINLRRLVDAVGQVAHFVIDQRSENRIRQFHVFLLGDFHDGSPERIIFLCFGIKASDRYHFFKLKVKS